MNSFIFLPKIYELEIREAIDNYLISNSVVIIKGVYKNRQYLEINTPVNSLVYDKNLLGGISFIKNDFFDVFEQNFKELLGFCLEGDLEQETPELFEIIKSKNDCFIFYNSNEYLDFENNIISL